MQGCFVNGARPRYTKDLKAAVAETPESVSIEATSWFGNEYDGPLADAPEGSYAIVGPDPERLRNWYATITVGVGKTEVE
jgi:hypothetical protein